MLFLFQKNSIFYRLLLFQKRKSLWISHHLIVIRIFFFIFVCSTVPFPKEQHFRFLSFLLQRNGICVFLLFLFQRNNILYFLLFLFQRNCIFDYFCCSFSKGTTFAYSIVPFLKEQHFDFSCSFFKGTTYLRVLLFLFQRNIIFYFRCSFFKGMEFFACFVVPFSKEQHFIYLFIYLFLLFLFQRNGICIFYYLRSLVGPIVGFNPVQKLLADKFLNKENKECESITHKIHMHRYFPLDPETGTTSLIFHYVPFNVTIHIYTCRSIQYHGPKSIASNTMD